MALLIGDNFSYNGKKPNFERDSFETLAALKAFAEANIDNGHIAYCAETNKHYIFNDSNSDDATTGKWRVLESEFSDKVNVSDLDNYLTKEEAQSTYQPVGDYALKSDISDLASKDEIPTKVSELENDSNFLTSIPEEYVTDTELQEAISGIQFKLPIATDSVLGGIKIGAGLSINPDTGVLSVTGGGTADAVDWANVTSKPQINEHDLVSGNNTLDSLGIQPAGDYALKSEIPDVSNLATKTELATKQDALVSGTNIKTINGTSLLGSGNIVIEASGGSGIMDVLDNKTYARTQGSWVDLTDYLTWAEL